MNRVVHILAKLQLSERALHRRLGAAEVFGAGRNQYVYLALDSVMIGLGGMLLARDVRDIAQQQRIMSLLAGLSAEHRHVSQGLDRVYVLLEILSGQKIVVAGFWIDPA